MKRFFKRVSLLISVPFLALLLLFFAADPFKTLRPFSFQYFDKLNRDYLSSELFLRNDPSYHYDSFMLGSSRCYGFNTYQWKSHLSPNSRQFLFQAWCETLTGMQQKLDYLDRNGNELRHVLLLIDIPGTFAEPQTSRECVYIKHYRFSGQPRWAFQACMFWGFLQMPSRWLPALRQLVVPEPMEFTADTVTNDLNQDNRFADVTLQPTKDSLADLSDKARQTYLKRIEGKSDANLRTSEPLITDGFQKQLRHLKEVFDKHHTDYRIVVSPAYCYTHLSINPQDLELLKTVFGSDRVFDYSGKNGLTVDCYNFSDAEHFCQHVGWQIIEDIYNK